MANFKTLRVWQLGIELVRDIEQVVEGFPARGSGELKAQLRRAVISIASNVAEGANRGSDREFKRFVGIALGSCGEVEAQLYIAHGLGWIADEVFESIAERVDYEGRMLRRLGQAL